MSDLRKKRLGIHWWMTRVFSRPRGVPKDLSECRESHLVFEELPPPHSRVTNRTSLSLQTTSSLQVSGEVRGDRKNSLVRETSPRPFEYGLLGKPTYIMRKETEKLSPLSEFGSFTIIYVSSPSLLSKPR